MPQILLEIIVIALIISFLVIIHELGHFIVAKLAKIKVEEFGLGYPPRALSLFTWAGTLFSLNWIPFGGFVKMEGEEGKSPDHQDSNAAFYKKSALARLAVILAGASVNFIFGVVAFSIVFSFWGIPIFTARIGQISPDSPAAIVGIPEGVEIRSIESGEHTFSTKSISDVQEVISQFSGQEVTITTTGLCRQSSCADEQQKYTLYVRTPEETPQDQGAMGVVFQQVDFYPWWQMPFRGAWYGLIQAILLGFYILQALLNMVTQLFIHGVVPQEVSGPVGIVVETRRQGIIEAGFLSILNFTGMLSVNLAIMNVLPIPALDGGRAVFIILERIFGKKRIAKIEPMANYGGYIVLLSLIVLVTARDIWRIII